LRIIRAEDGSPEGQRLELALDYHRRRTTMYGGYDPVMGAAAIGEVSKVIDPESLGLQAVSDRRFAAARGEFTKIVEIAAMKGASYVLRWGLSLPYVPLGLKRPVRYGRTVKSARLSLWWGSHRDPVMPIPEHAGYIGTLHGVRGVHDDAVQVWRASRPAAFKFWDRTRDLTGVLEIATELMNAPGGTTWGTPLAGAVAALTAARLGREQHAHQLAAATPLHGDQPALLTALIDQQLGAASALPR